eukprot:8852787-Lingulodinium_polyedra.AAC.1
MARHGALWLEPVWARGIAEVEWVEALRAPWCAGAPRLGRVAKQGQRGCEVQDRGVVESHWGLLAVGSSGLWGGLSDARGRL